MKIVPFIAESAADAVTQIREQLGAEAVVVNVRKLPSSGLARLWQSPRIEVLACVAEPPATSPGPLEELRKEVAALRERLAPGPPQPVPGDVPTLAGTATSRPATPPPLPGSWRVGTMLESMGVLPLLVQRLVERLRARNGEQPPPTLAEELLLAQKALAEWWEDALPKDSPANPPRHLFVGPPGVGKTTCLCKWLAQATLLGDAPARVWRLDGQVANSAAMLEVYGEILGVPVERWARPLSELPQGEVLFVDLPGVALHDQTALEQMSRRVGELPGAELHLVLNAAYETPILLAQARFFSTLPIRDLILTHLDEENRWGKLWNLVLGTNYTIRFLSAGQNVPGDFQAGSPELMTARVFA